jgi:hypothetical protein
MCRICLQTCGRHWSIPHVHRAFLHRQRIRRTKKTLLLIAATLAWLALL